MGEHRLSPREFSGTVLKSALVDDGRDCVLAQVEITGDVGGKPRSVRYRLIDYYDDHNGLSAMMRTTAFPAAIILQMQADGRIAARGTVPQELAVPTEAFMRELAGRDIQFVETWTE
jgi:saccharopine dehydrogenase-like NADP-dependent oxidoreductase